MPAASVTWSAAPAASASFPEPGLVRFEATGSVTLTARADGQEATTSVTISAPPDLVFDMARDGNRDIFRAALDGRDVERLTSDPTDDTDPTVGGGTLVFTSRRSGNAELFARPIEGTQLEQLTETEDDEIQPALSRDGQRVAFASDRDGVFQVWTAALDGANPVRATDGLGFDAALEGSPSWAADGGTLALMSTARGNADVWTVEVPGSDGTPVADGTEPELEPAWHPTEEQLVFAAVTDGDAELFHLDLTTGTLTRLTTRPGSDGQPAWLPDGRIVYTAWTDGEPALRWLDPADPELVQEIPIETGERPQNPHGIFE